MFSNVAVIWTPLESERRDSDLEQITNSQQNFTVTQYTWIHFAISTFARLKEMSSGLLLMMILVIGPKVHLITERLKQKKCAF